MPHIIGEKGPELFVPDSSGYVVPNNMFGRMGGGGDTYNVTINMPTGSRGEDIVREIERYTRRRGQANIPVSANRRF
jgi:hypothetical protein